MPNTLLLGVKWAVHLELLALVQEMRLGRAADLYGSATPAPVQAAAGTGYWLLVTGYWLLVTGGHLDSAHVWVESHMRDS